MAQVRQENEEYQSGQIACYAEYGLTPVKATGGEVLFAFGPDNPRPDDPAWETWFETAAADCNARVPLPEHSVDKTLDASAYERMLDTRACIIAHGYTVPEPPSLETWLDSDMSSAWNPYMYLIPGKSFTQADLLALDQACPQSGPNFVASA